MRAYGQSHELRVLVETGTFYGDMVASARRRFERIISIELDRQLYERARQRFGSYANITILHGDSAQLLARVTDEVREPCLFWLDAHYSGGETARGKRDTPIEIELGTLLARTNPRDVILIDDARLFVGGSYPTLEDLRQKFTGSHLAKVEVRSDIIRIHRSD